MSIPLLDAGEVKAGTAESGKYRLSDLPDSVIPTIAARLWKSP